jgi:hypothetical protein
MPGHNYMGPGTDVEKRIAHGHKPIDEDDYVSLLHDIDYMEADNAFDIYAADIKAFSRYPNTFHGYLGKLGMLAKMLNPFTSMFLQGHNAKLANELRKQIEDW